VQPLGKKETGYVEIFVVVCGEPARIGKRFGLRIGGVRNRRAEIFLRL
jgi:hypothetical protein